MDQVPHRNTLKAKSLEHIRTIQKQFPQEKIYVHFDRSRYSNQDTIWYKAYLIDNISQAYFSIGEFIHVKLYNNADEVLYSCNFPKNSVLPWNH